MLLSKPLCKCVRALPDIKYKARAICNKYLNALLSGQQALCDVALNEHTPACIHQL